MSRVLPNGDIRIVNTPALAITIIVPHDGKPGRFDVRIKAFDAKPAKSTGVGPAPEPEPEAETDKGSGWTPLLNHFLGRKTE